MTPRSAAEQGPAGLGLGADDPDGQGMALRAMGESITEIGMRQLTAPLTADDVAAAAFLADNVIAWCRGATAAVPLNVERLMDAYAYVHTVPMDRLYAEAIADAYNANRTGWVEARLSADEEDPDPTGILDSEPGSF